MPCYTKNPVLLGVSDCRRTVCIHCRIDFRLPALIEGRAASSEEILRNAPADEPGHGEWNRSAKSIAQTVP